GTGVGGIHPTRRGPDPRDLPGAGAAHQGATSRGQLDDAPTTVVGVCDADDEPRLLEPPHGLGDRGLRDALPPGRVADALRPVVADRRQQVEPRGREAELTVEGTEPGGRVLDRQVELLGTVHWTPGYLHK